MVALPSVYKSQGKVKITFDLQMYSEVFIDVNDILLFVPVYFSECFFQLFLFKIFKNIIS